MDKAEELKAAFVEELKVNIVKFLEDFSIDEEDDLISFSQGRTGDFPECFNIFNQDLIDELTKIEWTAAADPNYDLAEGLIWGLFEKKKDKEEPQEDEEDRCTSTTTYRDRDHAATRTSSKEMRTLLAVERINRNTGL